MTDTDVSGVETQESEASVSSSGAGSLVFISHDSRDAELAEAFSKLLKSASAGVLKCFRSSDKKGTEGIEFGDEWYKSLMSKLKTATDVVCLFTPRSLDRPWILYEAGVAKGKLDTPVHGIALGVPLKQISTGPFYQFQNVDDSEDALTKLVLQLTRRIPLLEPDPDVVKAQVKAFKSATAGMLDGASASNEEDEPADPVGKIFEEVKVLVRDLPSRVAMSVCDAVEPNRRRRLRHVHPVLLEDMMEMGEGDPTAILMAGGLFRDEIPWLYEITLDIYRAIRSNSASAMEREMSRLRRIKEFPEHFNLFIDEFDDEMASLAHNFPSVLERVLRRRLSRESRTTA